MSAYWSVTVLVALLTGLNTVAVIALIRQVGLLHLRVRPVPALEGEGGPSPGMKLSFATPPWELEEIRPEVNRVLLGFFSPTCKVCAPLMPAFQAIAAAADPDEAVVLVTEAEPARAQEYLRAGKVRVPYIAEPDCFTPNEVPGAPFAVVVDRKGHALASGGVNTLEQLEWVLEKSKAPKPAESETEPGDDRLADEIAEVRA
jgi:methylamine dehydrogenase accessory protein MauD